MLATTSVEPFAEGVRLAEEEMRGGATAAAEGNLGRARVCARRAVGAFLQTVAGELTGDVGTNAMANLRWLDAEAGLPEPEHVAAVRLAGGPRLAMAGGEISTDPLADAALIIEYFLRSVRNENSNA